MAGCMRGAKRGNELSAQLEEFAVLLDEGGFVRDFRIRAASVPRSIRYP